MMSPHSGREKRELNQNMKYVELLLVADKAEFEWHERSFDKTRVKLLEAANLVDKYYRALSIRVAVIGLEVWTDQDKINMSENARSVLDAFLSWRQKMLKTLPNDNAQLITRRSFQGTTIGLATLRTMCSDYQSGGVNQDHSPVSPVGVAATMAHEMGHNFGMSHDSTGCCQAKPEDGGCIMAAATGSPFPRVFSSCNVQELKSFLSSGGGKCLFNLPNTHLMYGGRRCGNGYLEEGEECDCGEEEECTSPCCNAKNCTLKAGAECAHGVCCQNCKLKSPGELCRAPSGPCDLPEYCDGKTEICPANFYLMDGTSCADGKAYCYTGMCLTLELQCQTLWGHDARPAPDLCFREVNKAGDMYGNCGKDQQGKYRSCKDRDTKCGKIQCSASVSKPIEDNAVRIETTVSGDKKKFVCLGTHVYNLQPEDEEQPGDTLDPGLVLTGTKCDSDSICFNGECRNASFLRAGECNVKCHGHGLCNNNHNCHCDRGWAPPWCNQSGSGGSVESGPVPPPRYFTLVLLLLLALFVVLVGFGLRWRYTCQNILLKSPSAEPKFSVTVEDKPLSTDGHIIGRANPTFILKDQNSASPRPRPAIVRPAVKPPPIPAYATEQRAQKPQVPPVTSPPQGQVSPQGCTQPFLRSPESKGLRPVQVSSPLPGPSSLPFKDLRGHFQPLAINKDRPNPPKRPPPPCPVNKQSVDQHKMKGLQSNINAVQ
ncbi:disintegrin and metalloproteinase domain-containing protein 19 [Austrofundulus limnaeus]|uniref:Disintegrin and metalloproteinase domain-containing protein 19 n=1 Tax=Austrofundulus limnaeus TaxID=52670 RepID=A0A2I4BQW5_AUSLI|nr:PREDICTED: disintegrin and metalloproteinase domain-containing protein 19 [Austrofundulus limnaeus]